MVLSVLQIINTVKLEQQPEFEERVAEKAKIRRQKKSDDKHYRYARIRE